MSDLFNDKIAKTMKRKLGKRWRVEDDYELPLTRLVARRTNEVLPTVWEAGWPLLGWPIRRKVLMVATDAVQAIDFSYAQQSGVNSGLRLDMVDAQTSTEFYILPDDAVLLSPSTNRQGPTDGPTVVYKSSSLKDAATWTEFFASQAATKTIRASPDGFKRKDGSTDGRVSGDTSAFTYVDVCCSDFVADEKVLQHVDDLMDRDVEIIRVIGLSTQAWIALKAKLQHKIYESVSHSASSRCNVVLYSIKRFLLVEEKATILAEELISLARKCGVLYDITDSVKSTAVALTVTFRCRTTSKLIEFTSLDITENPKTRSDLSIAQSFCILSRMNQDNRIVSVAGMDSSSTSLHEAITNGVLPDDVAKDFAEIRTVPLFFGGHYSSLSLVLYQVFEHPVKGLKKVGSKTGASGALQETSSCFVSGLKEILPRVSGLPPGSKGITFQL